MLAKETGKTQASMAIGQPPRFRLTSDRGGQKPPGTVPSWHSISGYYDSAYVAAPLAGGAVHCTRGAVLTHQRADLEAGVGFMVRVFCSWDRRLRIHSEGNCREELV